jgi:hypothetical protein
MKNKSDNIKAHDILLLLLPVRGIFQIIMVAGKSLHQKQLPAITEINN